MVRHLARQKVMLVLKHTPKGGVRSAFSIHGFSIGVFLFALCFGGISLEARAGDETSASPQAPSVSPLKDWQATIRDSIATKDLNGALRIAERRLAESPQDLEARGWRARLLGWLGRWKESEEEYRLVLERAPHDTDILLGLATVLSQQQRFGDALSMLDHARDLDPRRVDVLLARGRTLRALGRKADARTAFQEARARDPKNAEAKRGLDSLEEAPRHYLVVGSDFDFFNFTARDAQAQWLTWQADWGPRRRTLLGARFDLRGGQQAARWTGAVTQFLTKRDALTVGGSVGHDNGIVPKGEMFFEYGHGFSFGKRSFVRGLEANYQQRWLWYDAARILILTPNTVVYLPKDWMWSLSVSAARSHFPGAGVEWRPSGVTRLTFPVKPRVTGNLFFAVGTENYALVDQIGRFSARTFGGGVRVQVGRNSTISAYVAFQDRSQGRSQKSFGIAYGIRF